MARREPARVRHARQHRPHGHARAVVDLARGDRPAVVVIHSRAWGLRSAMSELVRAVKKGGGHPAAPRAPRRWTASSIESSERRASLPKLSWRRRAATKTRKMKIFPGERERPAKRAAISVDTIATNSNRGAARAGVCAHCRIGLISIACIDAFRAPRPPCPRAIRCLHGPIEAP
jgi:hypothetical protein